MHTPTTTYSLADIAVLGEQLLNQYTSRLLLDAFHRMDSFHTPGQTYTTIELQVKIGLTEDHNQLFHALLDILERAECIQRIGNQIVTMEKVAQFDTLEEIATFKQHRLDALSDESEVRDFIQGNLRLVDVCIEALPEILNGQRSYLDVMFPMGDRTLVGDIYKSSIQKYLNQSVAETIAQVTAAKVAQSSEEKIQILEVGAGTGGTTGPILEALNPFAEHITYWYTDIAAGFTRVGRREFGSRYSFMEFKALDISRTPAEQNFPEEQFDVVVCNNVLHATPVIAQTLTNIGRLLKPGGKIVINDLTKRLDFNTVTFGLTKDWWAFQDHEHRTPYSPTLTYTQWDRMLTQTGFGDTQATGIPNLAAEAQHQSIITATKNEQESDL